MNYKDMESAPEDEWILVHHEDPGTHYQAPLPVCVAKMKKGKPWTNFDLKIGKCLGWYPIPK